ncbi:MAG: T9SS C-terminal target domain-containing protein [Bacteroidetes bacterium]|nr:MAG: T9SS C-terminal target domain-containing protein [Bacteroidota bacterium]
MKKRLLLAAWIISMIVSGLAAAQELYHHDGHNSLMSFENLKELTEENFITNSPFLHLEGKIPQHRLEHYRSLLNLSDKEEKLPGQHEKNAQEKVNLDSLHYFVNEQVREKTYNQFDADGNLIRTEVYMLYFYQYEPFDIPVVIIDYSYNSQGQTTLERVQSLYDESLPEVEYIVEYELEFDYDHAGRVTFNSYKYHDYNVGELTNGWRWFRDYEDVFNREIYNLRQVGNGQEWINSFLLERTLFADGTTDMVYFKGANPPGDWTTGMKYDYISWYNTERYEDVYIYSYDAGEEEWEPNMRFYVTHNEFGRYEFFYEFHYHEESWWEKFRNTYHYDENHWQTYTLAETRPTPEAEYENYRMWTFEHDASGNMTVNLQQNWDADELSWINNTKIQHEFDHPAGYTLFLRQIWDNTEEVWENQMQEIRDFDNAGNMIFFKHQFWAPQFQHWYTQSEMIREFDPMNRILFEQRRQIQNPETLLWQGWGIKLQTEFDSNGYFNVREQHSWNTHEQEFEWESTRVYTHDYYGNTKKQEHLLSWDQETTRLELGYATYPVTLEIHSQGEPLEGAVLTMMGTTFVSDNQGGISFQATLCDQMTFDYMIEAEGYNTRQGQMKIDRKLDIAFNMVAEGTTTYNVTFIIKKGDLLLEDAMVYLTGYGHQYTCNEGHANFEDVMPENHIAFMVTYSGLVYHGTITVAYQNMTVEVDIDQVTSVIMAELPQVSIYPNPAEHTLYLSIKGLHQATVSIFDMSGRVVFEQSFSEGDHTQDAGFLNKGAYVVVIGHENFRKVIKLLKR